MIEGPHRRRHRRLPRGDPPEPELRQESTTTSAIALATEGPPRRGHRLSAQAIALIRTSPRPTSISGAALGQKGLTDEAIAAFREAIRLDPGSRRRALRPRHRAQGEGAPRRRHRRLPRGDPPETGPRREPIATSVSRLLAASVGHREALPEHRPRSRDRLAATRLALPLRAVGRGGPTARRRGARSRSAARRTRRGRDPTGRCERARRPGAGGARPEPSRARRTLVPGGLRGITRLR